MCVVKDGYQNLLNVAIRKVDSREAKTCENEHGSSILKF